MKVINKFTTNLKKALKKSNLLACRLGHEYVEPEHLLYTILEQKGSLGREILTKINLKAENLKIKLAKISPAKPIKIKNVQLSESTKKLLEKAVLTANLHHHKYIGTEHLLAGLLENKNAKKLLAEQKIDPQNFNQYITMVLKSTSKFPDLTEIFTTSEKNNKQDRLLALTEQTSALNLFANNLTNVEIQQKIDPVIGREEEITRLIQILARRTKNNPVLLGDAGVGKTAIVEGLAKKILTGEVPDVLINKQIWTLDLGLLVAGTMLRGEFENRLKTVMEEIKENPEIILFIDELHTIIGTGAVPGSLDAANILKPALARGEIRCIGATTFNEYKKNIETDPALERRFQAVIIDEPTTEKTIKILEGIKKNYENYHQVKITPQAIQTAVSLSNRYLTEKFLPDKAIDLIDEAASACKVKLKKEGLLKKIKLLEDQLRGLREQKQRAVQKENFAQATICQVQERNLLEQLLRLQERQKNKSHLILGEIGAAEIAQVVAKMTGVPVEEMILEDKEKLFNLEKELQKKIIGQNHIIKALAEFIRRAQAGISTSERPLGSCIFLGPSGVGKTELAKVLAERLFGTKDSLLRFDMSEFAESFNISKLIGAPAGYVGFREGGSLTEKIRRRPYALLLFDEIEKAHPEIFNLLLQVLEDGHLTDAEGKKINFKNTLIIMTSNIGVEKFNRETILGFATSNNSKQTIQEFEATKKEALKSLDQFFPIEFLNRVDKILCFNPLDLPKINKIVDLELGYLNNRLLEKNISLQTTPEVTKFLARQAFDPRQGARSVRRTVLEYVENPLAEALLKDKIARGDNIQAVLKNKKLILEKIIK